MGELEVWSVDRVAANELLGSLGIATTPAAMDIAARHLSRHRACAQDWAAERAQSTVIKVLETASAQHFERKSSDWTDGFRRAEEILMLMTTDEFVPVAARQSRSKGQVLRSMVRQARQAI